MNHEVYLRSIVVTTHFSKKAMEIPEETFLLIGQSLSRDPSMEEKKQNTETLFNSKTLDPTFAADDKKDGTEVCLADQEGYCSYSEALRANNSEQTDISDNGNQMMNSAILVRAEMADDDQHSEDKDSFTYSVTTPSNQDQETSDNDSDELSSDDFNQMPDLEPCNERKSCCPILTTTSTATEEEADDEIEYPVPDLIETTFAEPLSSSSKSPLCDYTVYEQQPPPPQSTLKCIYKQNATSSSLLRRGEGGETAWWDIVNGQNPQHNDR